MSRLVSSLAMILHPIATALVSARPFYIVIAVGLYAISVPVAAWRWRTVLRGLDRRAPIGRLILTILAAACVNNVTPSPLAAEACRVVALVRARIAVASTVVVSIVYERISEIPAVAALVLVALLVAGRGLWHAAGPIAVAASVLIALAIGVAIARRVPSIRTRLHAAAGLTLAPRALAAAAAVSGLMWTLDVMRLRAVAAAVGAPVSLVQSATLAAITIVAGLVPTIGGLGVIEGGLVGGLVAFGVRPADAAAITVIERAISYGLASIAGAIALSVLGGRALWNAARTRGDEGGP